MACSAPSEGTLCSVPSAQYFCWGWRPLTNVSINLLSVLPGVWVGLAGSVVFRPVEVSSTIVVIFIPRVVLLIGLAAVELGWWVRMAAAGVLVMAELEGVPVPGLGHCEMVSRIQSLSLVILEYTPGFIAWAQPMPQLTMPAR